MSPLEQLLARAYLRAQSAPVATPALPPRRVRRAVAPRMARLAPAAPRLACEECGGVVVCAPRCSGPLAAVRAEFAPFMEVDGRSWRRVENPEPETLDALKAETPEGCCMACDEPMPPKRKGANGRPLGSGRVCPDPDCRALIKTLSEASSRLRKPAKGARHAA